MLKLCKKCENYHPITNFSKKTKNKDGLQDYCKSCNKIDNHKFRILKPDYKQEWDTKNPGVQSKIFRNWCKNNAEKLKEIQQRHINSWGAGVYEIKNIVTGERYIGASKKLRIRYTEHFTGNEKISNKNLQASIKHYGKNLFQFKILEKVADTNLLLKRERYWIGKEKPEYNIYLYHQQ